MTAKWTKEQEEAIRLRDRNILVSAAAGSGKTAVLVERILSRVTDPDHPADIDRLLVVTFTRAAAGEMKERIGQALEKRLLEDPDNEHLQRQGALLHHAQIQHHPRLLHLCDPELFSSDRSGSGVPHRGGRRAEAAEGRGAPGSAGGGIYRRQPEVPGFFRSLRFPGKTTAAWRI